MNNNTDIFSTASETASGALDIFILLVTVGVVGYIFLFVLNLFWQFHLMRKEAETGLLLEISLEKDSEQDPFAIEQLWTSFHGLYLPWYRRIFRAQPFFSFEIKSENTNKRKTKDITFNIWIPSEYKNFVRQRILSIYPNAEIRILKSDYIPSFETTTEGGGLLTVETAELGLQEDSSFSLKTFKDFEADPLSSVTGTMTDLDNYELAVVQIVAQPVSYRWRKKAERILTRFENTGRKPSKLPEWTNFFGMFLSGVFILIDEIISGLFFRKPDFKEPKAQKSSTNSDRQKDIGEKTKKPPFSFQIRLLFATPYDKKEAQARIRDMIAGFNDYEGSYNGLKKEVVFNKKKTLQYMQNRHLRILDNDDIISTTELAGLCHLPNKNMKTPGLKKIQSKKVEAPVNMSDDNAFARAEFREGKQMIGLDERARMRHVYVTGMTGVGKYLDLPFRQEIA